MYCSRLCVGRFQYTLNTTAYLSTISSTLIFFPVIPMFTRVSSLATTLLTLSMCPSPCVPVHMAQSMWPSPCVPVHVSQSMCLNPLGPVNVFHPCGPVHVSQSMWLIHVSLSMCPNPLGLVHVAQFMCPSACVQVHWA